MCVRFSYVILVEESSWRQTQSPFSTPSSFTLQKSHQNVACIHPGWWPVNRGWLWIEWRLDYWRRLTTSLFSIETRPVLFAIRLYHLTIIVIVIPHQPKERTKSSLSLKRRAIGKFCSFILFYSRRTSNYMKFSYLMIDKNYTDPIVIGKDSKRYD